MRGRRQAIVSLSPELVRELLGADVTVLDARVDLFSGGGNLQLVVSCDQLDKMPEGFHLQQVDLNDLRERAPVEDPDRPHELRG